MSGRAEDNGKLFTFERALKGRLRRVEVPGTDGSYVWVTGTTIKQQQEILKEMKELRSSLLASSGSVEEMNKADKKDFDQQVNIGTIPIISKTVSDHVCDSDGKTIFPLDQIHMLEADLVLFLADEISGVSRNVPGETDAKD